MKTTDELVREVQVQQLKDARRRDREWKGEENSLSRACGDRRRLLHIVDRLQGDLREALWALKGLNQAPVPGEAEDRAEKILKKFGME